MRIAYIAPYQGPALLKRYPIITNLSLGASAKGELIAEQLQNRSHAVEIVSQDKVVERQLKVYTAAPKMELFNSNISIFYSSAFPVRFLSRFCSRLSIHRLVKARHRIALFDVVLICKCLV